MKSFLFMLVAAMFSLAAWAAPPPTHACMPNGSNDDAMQIENVDHVDVVGVAHVGEIESVDNVYANNNVTINGCATSTDVGVSRGDCPIVLGSDRCKVATRHDSQCFQRNKRSTYIEGSMVTDGWDRRDLVLRC